MIPERIPTGGPGEDVTEKLCSFAAKWRISSDLARKLLELQAAIAPQLQIVSGYRTPSEQQALIDSGEQAAAVNVSTHCSCPATGADVQVIGWTKRTAPLEVRRVFVGAARLVGLRVGGGSKADPKTGLPTDWNHVDLGPRTT